VPRPDGTAGSGYGVAPGTVGGGADGVQPPFRPHSIQSGHRQGTFAEDLDQAESVTFAGGSDSVALVLGVAVAILGSYGD
jgi:hypothetical protein